MFVCCLLRCIKWLQQKHGNMKGAHPSSFGSTSYESLSRVVPHHQQTHSMLFMLCVDAMLFINALETISCPSMMRNSR